MGHFAIAVLVGSFGAGVLLAIFVTGRAHGSHDPRDTAAWRRYGRDQGLAMVGVCIGVVAFTFPKHLAWWRWVLISAAVGFVIASVSFIGDLRQSLADNKTARAVEAQLLAEKEKRKQEEQEEQDAAAAEQLAQEQRVEQERHASAHSDAVWAAMRAELDDVVANWPIPAGDHPDPEKGERRE